MTKNDKKNTGLTRLQNDAVTAVVASKTYKEAAELAGCSESSVYKWMKNPVFKAAVLERENGLRAASGRRLARDAQSSLDVIHNIMTDEGNPAGLRLQAAKAWQDYLIKTGDITQLEDRVTKLEAKQHDR
jgi:hypothetical protein